MQNELVIVLDFGGQYKELIARRIRECHVLSRILPGTTPVEKFLRAVRRAFICRSLRGVTAPFLSLISPFGVFATARSCFAMSWGARFLPARKANTV